MGYQPSNYNIQELTITSASGATLDVSNIFSEINLFEDLFNSSMHGTLILNDANNYIKNLPIYGNEKITISYHSPTRKNTTKTFRIYKIEKRKMPRERWQVYQLNFVSQETLDNQTLRISKSYPGMLISDIANDIQTNILNSSFNILEPTTFIHKVIFPLHLTPMAALNWLATRANSAQYSGANYFYYETQYGFNFNSLEYLMEKPAVVNYLYQVTSPTYTPSLQEMPTEKYSVDNYDYDRHIEGLDNLLRGMYGNQLITHNQIRKIWKEHTFDYVNSWDQYVHLEDNYLAPSDYTPSKFGTQRLYPTEEGFTDQYNRVESWMPVRISQLQQLQNTHITIRVSGDSARCVGETVNFFMPSPEPVYGENQMDTYAGKFIITSIRHIISTSGYSMSVGLCKDSVSNPFT